MRQPTHNGTSEYVEKRSRFIGSVVPAETEEDAKAFIADTRKKYHDARHNCWCYIIEGKAERYSDDGEPQGTAGIPMLEVFKRECVGNFACVVTRYFGGVLLGAGGLLRAYTKAAKDALDASDPAETVNLKTIEFDCAYNDFESLKNAVSSYDGKIVSADYAEKIHITAVMPETEEFSKKYLWKK